MRLERDTPYPHWVATQGLWFGVGDTKLAAVLDCVWACAEALALGLRHPWGGRRYELRRWWSDVFRVGDD